MVQLGPEYKLIKRTTGNWDETQKGKNKSNTEKPNHGKLKNEINLK